MASTEVIAGVAVLLVAVALFLFALLIYTLYIYCCRKSAKDVEKPVKNGIENNNVKAVEPEADEESGRGTADSDEALDSLENVINEEDRKMEGAVPSDDEQPNIFIVPDDTYAQVNEVETAPAEEEASTMSLPRSDKTSPKALTSSQLTFNGPEADGSETLERKEVKDLKRSQSIRDRVSYFESSNNSLVRPAKRGDDVNNVIQPRVVAGLLSDFEKSDNVLTARQAPEAGDVHVIQMRAEQARAAQKADDTSASAADETEGAAADPVYAVPDPSRKSVKSHSDAATRPTSDMSEQSDQNVTTPEVPQKADDM